MHVPSPDALLSLRDIVREKMTVREGVLTRPEVEAEPLLDTVPPAPPSPLCPPGLICWLSLCWLSLCWLSLSALVSLVRRSTFQSPGPRYHSLAGCRFHSPLAPPRFPSLTEAFIDRAMFRDPFARAHCSLISGAHFPAHRGARGRRPARLNMAGVSLKLLGVSRRMAPLIGAARNQGRKHEVL